ncbi:MAG: hypothetical protein QGG54_15445, partial [Gammaproteobacteria bacterium]|nr:hypothetical protein [Gammaproteobacteria bacterium]
LTLASDPTGGTHVGDRGYNDARYLRDADFTQDSGILVGTGAGTFAEETGATLRTSIGVVIGVDVEAYDANIAKTDVAETLTANWVNTANPWADNEVADNITASNYLPLAGGTMAGNLTMTGARYIQGASTNDQLFLYGGIPAETGPFVGLYGPSQGGHLYLWSGVAAGNIYLGAGAANQWIVYASGTLDGQGNAITNVEDEAYGAGWNGVTEVPTKNAVYDKIETLGTAAYSNASDFVQWVTAPASNSAAGTAGQVAYGDNYFYVCVSNATWRRSAIAAW